MEFNEREPIYLQIIDNFKRRVINGSIHPSQQIPSRRELARELGINPNTVQRAYMEMESSGLIHTLRGQGSVLTDDRKLIQQIRNDKIEEIITNFVETMLFLGVDKESIIRSAQSYFARKQMKDKKEEEE